MVPQVNANNPSEAPSATCPATNSPRNCAPRKRESLLRPNPTTRGVNVEHQPPSWYRVPKSRVSLERVKRCEDLWFEDGDVIIRVEDDDDSMLFRVHRSVLIESGVEPFCTTVDCDYPTPETCQDDFMDGVWVLLHPMKDPLDIMYVLKWIYDRPSISKRSKIPFAALEAYLTRSDEGFSPAMRRCAMEYLWNMLPTNLNYHQRVPTLVEDCYSKSPSLFYKPYVLYGLLLLAKYHRLVAILPLLYYYVAQWPLDWITDGVPARSMEFDNPSPGNYRFPLSRGVAITILAGREQLIGMRRDKVFNFVEAFTSNGTTIDDPVARCNRERRPETGETCFQWLMRLWFHMNHVGFTSSPNALEVMNMGQWEELQKNCCEACGERVMEHMLKGRDEVWDALPSAFGFRDWNMVLERQKRVEEQFSGGY